MHMKGTLNAAYQHTHENRMPASHQKPWHIFEKKKDDSLSQLASTAQGGNLLPRSKVPRYNVLYALIHNPPFRYTCNDLFRLELDQAYDEAKECLGPT